MGWRLDGLRTDWLKLDELKPNEEAGWGQMLYGLRAEMG